MTRTTAFASFAHAGHWEVSYSGGSASGDHAKRFAWDGSNYSGAGAYVSGPVVATFDWTPDSPGDTSAPLDHVYVLETCSASGANDNSSNPHFNAPAAEADNGLGSGTVHQANHYPGDSSGYLVYTAVSQGTRVTYKSIGSAREFQVSCSPSAQGGMNWGSAVVAYRAEVTPYALSIHSDRDESFHKGANGPESNLTDVLTPRFGDTWVDPASFVRQGNQDDPDLYSHYVCFPTFVDELIGGWTNPLHQWNVDGTSFTDDFVNEYDSVSKEWDYSEDAFAALSDSPDKKVVTLTVVQDGGNGGSASATYTLRIHHPQEGWHKIGDLGDIPEDVGDLKAESPGVAYIHGSIHCTWNNPGPEWKLLSTAVTVGSADIKGSLWKYFFRAAGIAVTDLGPKPDNGAANFDDCWGTAQSTTSGSWSDDMGLYQMSPRLVLIYHAHKYEADGYGPHGYVGPVREGATDPNAFKIGWAGDFSPYRPPSGGGS